MESSGGSQRPFTLVEMLVLTAVIAVLISLLLPALEQARAKAKAMQCLSQERQLGLGLMTYAIDNEKWGVDYVHWGSGQCIFHDNTWIHDYFPDRASAVNNHRIADLFACPATDSKPLASCCYYPGRRISTRQYTSYFIAFGTSNHTSNGDWCAYDFYKWHCYWNNTEASQYRPPCPNLRFLGDTWKDIAPNAHPGREYYLAEPSVQGMLEDMFDSRDGVWGGYGLGTNNPNNHYGMGGLNIMFFDGHAEWRRENEVLMRHKAYGEPFWW